jgi:hypothetical protein
MNLDFNQSRIIARKSNLHNDAVHIDCELWGHTESMNPDLPARLLNFFRKDTSTFGVSPHNTTDKLELVPMEEFSKQLWKVTIVDDWDQLDELQETKVYAQIIHTGRMFGTVRFDK